MKNVLFIASIYLIDHQVFASEHFYEQTVDCISLFLDLSFFWGKFSSIDNWVTDLEMWLKLSYKMEFILKIWIDPVKSPFHCIRKVKTPRDKGDEK